LHQNAFHDVDTYTSIEKQYIMIKTIIYFYRQANDFLNSGVDIDKIERMKVLDMIARMKYIEDSDIEKINSIFHDIDSELGQLKKDDET